MNMNGDVLIEVATSLDPAIYWVESPVATTHDKPIEVPAFECRKWPYILALPLMWTLILWVAGKKAFCKAMGWPKPAINTLWFDGLGQENRKIKEGSASWLALHVIYNHCFGQGPRHWVDDFWIGMMNAQAVRNRFKLVRQEVKRAVLRFSETNDEVRIISLACGSAQAVIEVMAELKLKGIVVKALLVDRDESALEYAKSLAVAKGVGAQIEIKQTSVSRVELLAKDFQPHIIEMLGLLDYVRQDKAIVLAGKIRASLQPGGMFMTCNIAKNPEQFFLLTVINWWMIYRSPQELADVGKEAGFSDVRLVYEPQRIHGILIAVK